jgi:hypothetical protein
MAKLKGIEFTNDHGIRETVGGSRLHFVASSQKMSCAISRVP